MSKIETGMIFRKNDVNFNPSIPRTIRVVAVNGLGVSLVGETETDERRPFILSESVFNTFFEAGAPEETAVKKKTSRRKKKATPPPPPDDILGDEGPEDFD